MPQQFLRLCHAALGYKRLDGFYYKTLARKLHISKPLLSQYLRGDIEIPQDIREKMVELLGLDDLFPYEIGTGEPNADLR
jgi:transcriptional regulator with XRE-family HTH domain